MKASDFGVVNETEFAKSLTIKAEYLDDLYDWLRMDDLDWAGEPDVVGDYAIIWFDDAEAYNQASDWKDENEEFDIQNGDQVRLKPRYADRNPNEVFTVSQCDPDRRKCWIGDDQGRGWYARFDQIEKVNSGDKEDMDEAKKDTTHATYADRMSAHKASLQKGECPHCHGAVQRQDLGKSSKYHCPKCPASWGLSNEDLKEFAPDGFNDGGDDGEDDWTDSAYEEGFVKGVSFNDSNTLTQALKVRPWDSMFQGKYKNDFVRGFIDGRKDKIAHAKKQYNLNLRLRKDGSIVRESIEEGKRKLPRYFIIKMGQGWKNRMKGAVDSLPLMSLAAGYSDGSTSWAIFVEDDKAKFDEQTLDYAMRDALGGYEHWLEVQEIPYEKAQDMLDENVTEGKWFRTAYGWAGGRNEKTGGTYKQPKDKSQKTTKDKAKAKNNKNVDEGDVIPVDFKAKSKSSTHGDGNNVVKTKFATKQAQKAKDKYQIQSDLADQIPLYDPKTGRAVLPKYAKGHEEKFDHFEAKPSERGNWSKIIGVTKDGKAIMTSTLGAPIEVASKFVDALNRGGFSDVPITKVPLKGYNENMNEADHDWQSLKRDMERAVFRKEMEHHINSDDDSTSYGAVRNSIIHRIAYSHPDLIEKYGADKVVDAIIETASFYGSNKLEEIGGSDVTAFVQSVVRQLRGVGESKKVTESDKVDTVTMDVPLMIRLLEFAKEDAKTDMDLHELATRLIKYAKKFGKLTMKNYDKIVKGVLLNPFDYEADESKQPEQPIEEAKGKASLATLVRALRKHPSLKVHSTENGRASSRAWIDIVGNIKSSEVLQILQAVDKAAKKEKVDIGFGPEIIFRGSNWNVKVMSAAESGEAHNTLFVEVFKSGALGKLARAGIDEPEGYA